MKLLLLGSLVLALFVTISLAAKKSSSSTAASNGNDSVNSNETCVSIYNETAVLVEPVLLVGKKEFPTTGEAIDKHCELGALVYKRMRKYGKCLTGLGRQALNVFLHGLKKFMRSICLSPQKKEETIRDLKCASNETLPGWNKCLFSANRQLDWVRENSTGVTLVGNICCVYSEILDCIGNNTGTQKDCAKGANTTKFFKHSIGLVLKEVMELVCSKYSTREECELNNPEGLQNLRSVAVSDRKVEGAFLISSLIDIVNKLGANGEEEE